MFFFNKELCKEPLDDPLIKQLWHLIRYSVRALAVLMTLVIIWGIFDVVWVLYQRLMAPPVFLLNINDILATFGAFMAVLIAIEIFANIVIYLEYKMIHLKLVISTALMAAARKVIVLDFKKGEYEVGYALGAIIVALGVSYWLVGQHNSKSKHENTPFMPCEKHIEDSHS